MIPAPKREYVEVLNSGGVAIQFMCQSTSQPKYMVRTLLGFGTSGFYPYPSGLSYFTDTIAQMQCSETTQVDIVKPSVWVE